MCSLVLLWQYNTPLHPFFTFIRCREWLKLLLFSSRQGSALEVIWCSFKLFFELHQKVPFCKHWSYHCYAVFQSKKALNTGDVNKIDTAYHTLNKQLEHLSCWESKHAGTVGIATNYHHYKETTESDFQCLYKVLSSPFSVLLFQFFLRGTSIAMKTKKPKFSNQRQL